MKLLNVKNKNISTSFRCIVEGRKGDWIAVNQGAALLAKIEKNNDQMMHGKTAQEVAEYIEKEGGAYAPFYSKLYLSGEVKKMEDFYRLTPIIKAFEKHKRHLDNKDISSYSLKMLTNVLKPFMGKISHKHVNPTEDERFYKNKTMTKHFDSPTFEVIVPHTVAASCHLGKGTKWCTAADGDSNAGYDMDGYTDADGEDEGSEHNRFHEYNDDGDLYVIRAGNRRFQLHYESNGFMDEDDNPISEKDIEYLSRFPQYKEFLEAMIQKHHFKKSVLKNGYRSKEDYNRGM